MRVEVLEGEKLGELVSTQGPFHGQERVVAQLGDAQVVVVRDDFGVIIAHWPIWLAVHLEPLWIDPKARKNPAVAKLLIEQMKASLAEHRITTAFAVIGHEDLVMNLPLAARIGFQRIPGDLFFIAEEKDGSSSGTGDLPRGAVLHEPGAEQAGAGGGERRPDGPPDLRR